MGSLVAKIVLTGGPCGGKTKSISRIKEDLTNRGYKVFTVAESATELIDGGIKCFGDKPIDSLEFQRLILEYQLEKSAMYEKAVKLSPPGTKCVIIYDRGEIDNKAYINQQKFTGLLNSMGLDELSIMDSYDMIIHLVTAADGKEEFYTLENNTARTETPEEARRLDEMTVNAWVGHDNLKIFINENDFNTKLSNVLDAVHNLLENSFSTRRQRKYLIDINSSDLGFLNNDNSSKILVEQSYVDGNGNCENRLRKRTLDGADTYFLTIQRKLGNGKSEVYMNKRIDKKAYEEAISTSNIRSIRKYRYTFVYNKQYFKLDIFNNFGILEVEPIGNRGIELPSSLKTMYEVTDDINYQNYNMAMLREKSACKQYAS